ncbi:prenyltransferase/squalene oxidase repeat-containing protein [Streptomyces sp. NPDC017095]|uniref:prenyltransferase/squalene oxidase repeat-containing protein n=1 Tax=Streptomyces sp. NPDC017095 TaxID=3364977 RepID=UPI0037940B9C
MGVVPSPRDGLTAARQRLAGRVLARIGRDGLVQAPCRSRALESALALPLLRRYAPHPAAAARLTGHLRHRAAARPEPRLDALVAAAALRPGGSGRALGSVLDGFVHFTGARKRLLLRAVDTALAGPGAAPASASPADLGGTTADLHPWSAAVVTACLVIETGRADTAQRRLLLAAQRGPGIWEGHVLCHLLTLHALARLGGHEDVVTAGVAGLPAHQRADGGFPFICGEEVFVSALAASALAGSADETARRAAHRVCGRLARLQGDDGGWAYAPRVEQTDVDTTCVVLEALRATDPARHHGAVRAGERYLLALRGADGGFPTYRAGAPSEVVMTAAAAGTLDPAAPGAPEVLAGALTFITGRQNPAGTYEEGWSRSDANALLRTQWALRRAALVPDPAVRRAAREATGRALGYLAVSRNADGGWGQRPGEPSDPVSTAFSLGTEAVAGAASEPSLRRGLGYLLSRQAGDGSFPSRPDSTGPRGLVFDVPALADVYVLRALTCVQSLGGTGRSER